MEWNALKNKIKRKYGRAKKILRPWKTIKILQARIDHITDIGVYPQSTISPNGEKVDRTDWQEGWNAHGSEIIRRYVECTKKDWNWKQFIKEKKEWERENVSYKVLWERAEKIKKRKARFEKVRRIFSRVAVFKKKEKD